MKNLLIPFHLQSFNFSGTTVSKSQGHAFKTAKDQLNQDEGILVGDFAENYSFLVQDAAQGYHWNNSQCTLHPFVFYYKDSDSKLQHQSFCFISDGTKHSTAMVYTFLNELIPLLCSRFPTLKKLIYFTDGCAGQYKNRFNFINLSFIRMTLVSQLNGTFCNFSWQKCL